MRSPRLREFRFAGRRTIQVESGDQEHAGNNCRLRALETPGRTRDGSARLQSVGNAPPLDAAQGSGAHQPCPVSVDRSSRMLIKSAIAHTRATVETCERRATRSSRFAVPKTQNSEPRTSDPASLACLAQLLNLPIISLLCLSIWPR